MAGIPQNFQAISNVLANYNFVDIAAGTGYINFYAGNTVDKVLLSNFTYYSDVIKHTSGAITFGADQLLFDVDFDTVLNRPLDVRGLGIVNVPIACNTASGSSFVNGYVTVILRKWNGVETDIVSNTSSGWSVASAITYDTLSVDLDIPLTHFKIGETLRLTLKVYGSGTGDNPGAARYVSYADDPKGRTTGWDTSGAVPSQLMFQCPVRLNL